MFRFISVRDSGPDPLGGAMTAHCPNLPVLDAIDHPFMFLRQPSVRLGCNLTSRQACEACRGRKQKCDEGLPKCGYCTKAKVACVYRETQPTKKDKTLVEILDIVTNIHQQTSHIPDIYNKLQNIRAGIPPSLSSESSSSGVPSMATLRSSGQPGPIPQQQETYRHASAIHKMMAWPAVRRALEDFQHEMPDLQTIFWGSDFRPETLGQQGHDQRLPRGGIESITIRERVELGIPRDNMEPIQLMDVDYGQLEFRARVYFNTFNRIHPVIDRQSFMEEVFPAVLSSRFEENAASTLVCLVLALGEVALAEAQYPSAVFQGQPVGLSGIAGALGDRPPGLVFFNEARRRIGFSMTGCDLENIQMYILAGLYYGSCFRHMEFWRMTISASLACHALISSNSAEIRSTRGDQVRRASWHCLMIETYVRPEFVFDKKTKNNKRAPAYSPTIPLDYPELPSCPYLPVSSSADRERVLNVQAPAPRAYPSCPQELVF
ncbi:hypothetical protein EsH8_VI_000581 [Colletotrichum jinshuiense]